MVSEFVVVDRSVRNILRYSCPQQGFVLRGLHAQQCLLDGVLGGDATPTCELATTVQSITVLTLQLNADFESAIPDTESLNTLAKKVAEEVSFTTKIPVVRLSILGVTGTDTVEVVIGITDDDEEATASSRDGVAELKRIVDQGSFFFSIEGRLIAALRGSVGSAREPLVANNEAKTSNSTASFDPSTIAAIVIGCALAVILVVGAVLITRRSRGSAAVHDAWASGVDAWSPGAVQHNDRADAADSASIESHYSGTQVYLPTSYTAPEVGESLALNALRDSQIVRRLIVFQPGAFVVRRVPLTGLLELWVQEAAGPVRYRVNTDDNHRYQLDAGPKPRPHFSSIDGMVQFFKANPYRKHLTLIMDAGSSDSVWVASL